MADSADHASVDPADAVAPSPPAAPAAESTGAAAPEAAFAAAAADASHRGSSDASAPPTGEALDDLSAQLSDSVALFVDGVDDLNGVTVRSARDALEASAQLAIFEAGVPDFKAALREALMQAVQQRMKREAADGAAAAETANASDASSEDSSDDSDSASDGSSSEDEDEAGAGEGAAAAAGGDGALRRRKKKRSLAGAGGASSPAGASAVASPRKGGSVFSKQMALTAPLAEFFGVDRLARGEASKRLWAYIKEKGLPKNARGQYVCDAALEAAFKRKTMDFKSASKGLAAGMKDPDLLVDGGAAAGASGAAKRKGAASGSRAASSSAAASSSSASSSAAASPGNKRSRPAADAPPSSSRSARGTPAKRPRADGEGSATSGGGGSGGFNKPVPLSAELSAFMGEPTASRTGVTKALWAHIKAAGLQKEGNRSIIVLDAKMAPLFPGVAEIGMFGMNKGLARHFKPAQ